MDIKLISKKDNILKRLLKHIYRSKFFNPFRKYGDKIMEKIERSIRFEVMMVVAICFVTSFIFYGFMNKAMIKENRIANIEYNYNDIKSSAEYYAEAIQNEVNEPNFNEESYFNNLFNEINDKRDTTKVYITDLDGNVLKKSSNVVEDKIDIFSVVGGISNIGKSEGEAAKYIYPIKINEERRYFLYEETPRALIRYDVFTSNRSFLALILSFILFVILFIIITNIKMKYLDEIGV